MSAISAVNWAAAESVAGGNAVLAAEIATGLKLIHVLQVYTSAMVRICFQNLGPRSNATH